MKKPIFFATLGVVVFFFSRFVRTGEAKAATTTHLINDTSTVWQMASDFRGVFGTPITLFPPETTYHVPAPFIIHSVNIATNHDTSSNNHASLGNVRAWIMGVDHNVIASSTSVCYGEGSCGGAILTFRPGTLIPKDFILSFITDDGVQADAAWELLNVGVYAEDVPISIPPPPVPAPTPSSTPNPVLIIPGLFGSELKNGTWILQPRLAPYDALKATLAANGYVPGKTLFDFAYDWEKSNIVSAGLLSDKIKAIKKICGCGKVDLVAHSMGGLVARQYIESGGYADDVAQLILIGTPNLGSPVAYFPWEGGTTQFAGQTDLSSVLLKLILRQKAFEAGAVPDAKNPDLPIYNYIHASSSPVLSFRELLPVYDYLRDASGTMRKYPAGYPRNDFLSALNASSSLALIRARGVRVTNIVSDDQTNTTNIVQVNNVAKGSTSPLWSDGIPQQFEAGPGDGTVPVASAAGAFTDKIIKINGDHFSLPTLGEGEVVKTLTGSSTARIVGASSVHRFLSVFAFSPVDILVVAPDGKKIGEDSVSHVEVNEVAGGFYSGTSTRGENIFIPDPMDGSYRVTTAGTGTGDYRIETAYGYMTPQGEATTTIEAFSGNTRPGLLNDLSFTLVASSSQRNLISPINVVSHGRNGGDDHGNRCENNDDNDQSGNAIIKDNEKRKRD